MTESAALRILQGMKGVNTTLASERLNAAEFSGTIDTGSMVLNAMLSASLFGGVQDNKVTAFAGLSGTHKTFFMLGLAGTFLRMFPTGNVIWYDTEGATTADMMEDFGIDTTRVARPEIFSVEQLRNHVAEFLDNYLKMKREDRSANRVMIIVDSVSMLPSETEMETVREGKLTTPLPVRRAQAWASFFRTIQLRLSTACVPMLCSAHAGIDIQKATAHYQPMKERGAGESLRFASSAMLMLGVKKLRDDEKDQIGNIITVTIDKSRFTRVGKRGEIRSTFDRGLDKYYGLVPMALDAGVFKKLPKHIELPDGSKVYESVIEREPEKYFTPEVLAEIEKYAQQTFRFGIDEAVEEAQNAGD